MKIDLAGEWKYEYKGKTTGSGRIVLPGTLNEIGAGEAVSKDTEWHSGLHNPFWYEREEYKSGTEGKLHVPFLSQPKSHFCREAAYSRAFRVDEEGSYYLFIELSKWKLTAVIDGNSVGTRTQLCTPFVFGPICLTEGEHELTVLVDNSMQYPYRPDAHSVSDALGAAWNGMGGQICLMEADDYEALLLERKEYAAKHPVKAEICGRNFVINGKAEYLRGTHFGGDFPLTGIPSTDDKYWTDLFARIKEWGFNFVRCHSFCPPEAAFLAADRAGLFLQVECGMWNVFNPGNQEIFDVLMEETKAILECFGHHPSFVFLSPSNEPGGKWYSVLKKWVELAREYNRSLGFEGRRLFTAQSGWYYDTEPALIDGTDYVYFHRSAYGPIHGGMIRNSWGWKGKDYSPSLEGAVLPVISHEMGQWCSYPDFDVIDKFTGYAVPGNYRIFRSNAEANGVLALNKEFVYCSGRNQLRLLKEDIEANLRTKEISGYEYLDLHDYTGQGTAVVGLLDPFWDSKDYVSPEEFKAINAEVVILTRIEEYVYRNTDSLSAEFEISNYSGKCIKNGTLRWALCTNDGQENGECITKGELTVSMAAAGEITAIGSINVPLSSIKNTVSAKLRAAFEDADRTEISANEWELTIFAKNSASAADNDKVGDIWQSGSVKYTRSISEAEKLLKSGSTVIFTPYLSDMDFECPSLGIKNVFWNAQMGPNWSRELGIAVQDSHPLFKHFPTGRSGGWQWENILERARGFNFPADYASIVRVIDDWNRNYPLSLMFEGKVGTGRLFFCAADLNGSFEERPAAWTLKNAVLEYVGSTDFNPQQEIDITDIKRHLLPLWKGSEIISSVKVNKCLLQESANIYGINPNTPFVIHPEKLPAEFEIKLKKKVRCRKLYCLPIQNDRDFPGVIREYGIRDGSQNNSEAEIRGEWKNGFETAYSKDMDLFTDRLILTAYSTYGMGETVRWKEGHEGFYKIRAAEPLTVSMASLGIIYEDENDADDLYYSSDDRFWSNAARSTRREIEA